MSGTLEQANLFKALNRRLPPARPGTCLASSGEFSAIHLFSAAMLVALPVSIWLIRSRDARSHRQIQLSLYIGLLVAGAFAFSPDREIGRALLDLSLAA